jgi:hypothetical protein
MIPDPPLDWQATAADQEWLVEPKWFEADSVEALLCGLA